MQRIYLATTMNYGLDSDNPEELPTTIKSKKMDDMKKESLKKGIPLN